MHAMQMLLFGLGYAGTAVARLAAAAGWRVLATSRNPAGKVPPQGVELISFDAAGHYMADTTHILQTAPPGPEGDPVLQCYGPALAAAPHLHWAGLLSTTGVYGDRGGAWVDEDTEPAPTGPRGERRLAQEREWSSAFGRCAVDLFRVAGIYGPGRSTFDQLRDGTAKRIDRPDHKFGRIHRDDITAAVLAAMQQDRAPGARVLNLADDVPAPQAEVVAEAAALLGQAPPPLVPFAVAEPAMTPMGRSFWAESRQVASRKTQAALGLRWQYPSYREGLAAILLEEAGEGGVQQGQVLRT